MDNRALVKDSLRIARRHILFYTHHGEPCTFIFLERTPLSNFFLPAQIDVFQGLPSFFERMASHPWVAFIEMLLIGSVVYTVLRFLQGTRGVRLVRAVLMILAVSFAVVWLVAEQFGFERINVLYPYFILGVFLVSLVAFQTELRRLLIRLGEGGLVATMV